MVAGAWRLHLAMEWLQKQIGATNPVQALCDYLQVSASTLNRLFYAHLGCSPQAHIHAARMEYALELARNHPIKEIAFLLGYKHSNDLSRALSRYRRRRGTVAGPLEGEGAPRKAPSGR
jgi:transcriptional regulator GlxA family with amidase domain